jgi:hypothetical protein
MRHMYMFVVCVITMLLSSMTVTNAAESCCPPAITDELSPVTKQAITVLEEIENLTGTRSVFLGSLLDVEVVPFLKKYATGSYSFSKWLYLDVSHHEDLSEHVSEDLSSKEKTNFYLSSKSLVWRSTGETEQITGVFMLSIGVHDGFGITLETGTTVIICRSIDPKSERVYAVYHFAEKVIPYTLIGSVMRY